MSSLVGPVEGVSVAESIPVRDVGRVIAQIAKTWPTAVTTWPSDMTKYLEPMTAEEAWGPSMGQCDIRQTFGVLRQPDKNGFGSYGVLPGLDRSGGTLLGNFVRLCKRNEDSAGTVTYAGETYDPFWWGVVCEAARDTDGADGDGGDDAAGTAAWKCAGLGYLLEKMRPIRGHELNAASLVADPGEILEFNKVVGGDRSAAAYDIGEWSRSSFVHDRRGGAAWTADDVVKYLLYGHADIRESEIRWDLAGQTDALNFSDHWDLRGLTIYQALVRVINARRGVSFRIQMDAITGNPTVYVNSLASVAYSAGGATFPANNAATPVVFSGDRWKDGVSLVEKEGAVFDEVIMEGQRPLYTATLQYKADGTGDLVKGWDTALESSWTSTTKDPKYEHVWRRFKLRGDWDWTPIIGSATIANGRRTYFTQGDTEYPRSDDNDALYGEGGYTGGRIAHVPAPNKWPVTAIRFERLTGLIEGSDYKALQVTYAGTGQLPVTAVDWSLARLPPLIFLSANSGSTWSDVSADYTVCCASDTAAVHLGNSIADAVRVKAAVAASTARLAMTLSFRIPEPTYVSWRRPRASRPKDYPRRVVLPLHLGDTHFIMASTIVGLTGTAAKSMAAGFTTLTQINDLTQVLGAQRGWYSNPERELSWTEVGDVDITAARLPGTMVTTADLGDRVAQIYGIVTRRIWDFSEAGWSTSYRVERLKSDLQATL